MAGTDPRFPSQKFRDGILFAMDMAKPNAVQDQVTFFKEVKPVYARTDPSGRPYSWDDSPSAAAVRNEVVVDCVVEYVPRTSANDTTTMGEFNLSRAEILVFAEGLADVQAIEADSVMLGGNNYRILNVSPPTDLFDVTFYTIFVEARDES